MAVLGADLYIKRVVVVDQDVDIYDERQGQLGYCDKKVSHRAIS